MMRISVGEATDRIPLPIPCRRDFGITKFRCRRASDISPKHLMSRDFYMLSREYRAPKMDFLPAGRESKRRAGRLAPAGEVAHIGRI